MNYLINLYNQVAAGPKAISLSLISEIAKMHLKDERIIFIVPNFVEYESLISAGNLTFIKLKKYESTILKILYRIYIEFILIPYICISKSINAYLAFGNFLLSPVFGIRKIVLVHHPYLFDDTQIVRLNWILEKIERIKRVAFYLTARNVDLVVVESDHVAQAISNKYHIPITNITSIKGPLSANLKYLNQQQFAEVSSHRLSSIKKCLNLIFVSRFYPHKNHEFLIALSNEFQHREIKHQIFVTLNPEIDGVNQFIDKAKLLNLPIVNIGEIPQSNLDSYYKNCHALIFPSQSETFGIPMVEAIAYGLPVITPNLSYSRSVLADHAIYYINNDVKNCADKVIPYLFDLDRYQSLSNDSYQFSSNYLFANEWAKRYFELLKA